MACGVVLAGGASRRMGCDKALLEVSGETLVARAYRKLSLICEQVVVAAGSRRPLPGYRVVADGPGRGPAAGILGAAAEMGGQDLLVLACDLPAVTVPLLRRLTLPSAADWILPRWERGIEPLAALYRRAALAALAEQVRDGRWALHQLAEAEGLGIEYVENAQLQESGAPQELFINLNTPQDLTPLE